MLGLDLVEVDRLEAALARRPRLADRLFTPGEQAYAAGKARPAMHLAARFCAKEAVTKALRLDVLSPLDIEVVGGGTSDVGVRLTGEAATRADALGSDVVVSLTHTRGLAAGVYTLRLNVNGTPVTRKVMVQ